MRCADRQSGFSLIELLVAMAVFALVVLALLNLSGESTRTAAHVEERVLAGIVAQNLAAEAMLLEPRALATPAAGVEELGGRRWRWLREPSEVDTGDGGRLLAIRVRVGPGDGDRVSIDTQLFRAVP
ncbi:type II secretion system protein GspI [Luteimonas aestuarii]|uniref:Type II secretion system protein I n=1 Tax=Luteimonas aestuarii TaxID=453837 RepID=A0A4R5U4T0_9GAMM|nr:type II secretion system minor pseudopilin GspI [Luteimonas aestuarii]TDK28684.1 type II secretion system protein GspI [Luteimonas aestuarii]